MRAVNEVGPVRSVDCDDRYTAVERLERFGVRRQAQNVRSIRSASSDMVIDKNVPSGVGVPGAPIVVWVSSTNVDPSHTCIVFVVRFTRTDIDVDDNVTCDVGIQPVVWFGRTGNCTRSHSPSSERCTTRSFNGLPKYVGFVIPQAVVGSYATSSVPPGSVKGANNVTSGTIVATNVDKYVGETIGSGSGSGSGSATTGAGATTTGVSTDCVELTLAASGTSTTSGTTETGVFSAARSAATPSTCGIEADDAVGSGGAVDALLSVSVTTVAISTGSSRDSTPSRGAADAIATPLAITARATPTRTTPRFTAKKAMGAYRRWHRCVEGNGRTATQGCALSATRGAFIRVAC